MTDEQIIKALECCSKITFSCDGCPLKHFKYSECYELVIRSTLDLINRQKAKIDKMKAIVEQSDINCRRVINLIGGYERQVETAKTEALKEFAERLKEHKIDVDVSFGYGKEVYTEAVAVIEIDNLVKEMVDKNND